MSDPTLRPATSSDAAAVADLWHVGWHDGHAGHVPEGLTAARTLDAFRARTPGLVDRTTVAEVDGLVAGFVMVVGAEVDQVYVAPAHRGSGAASVLLAEAERQVAAGGHDVAWLAVVEGNERAMRFYRRQGWSDGGPLPYEVEAGGASYVAPCRRYVKDVSAR